MQMHPYFLSEFIVHNYSLPSPSLLLLPYQFSNLIPAPSHPKTATHYTRLSRWFGLSKAFDPLWRIPASWNMLLLFWNISLSLPMPCWPLPSSVGSWPLLPFLSLKYLFPRTLTLAVTLSPHLSQSEFRHTWGRIQEGGHSLGFRTLDTSQQYAAQDK